MVLKHEAAPAQQDLLYEEGVPVENRLHAQMCWEDLVVPLEAFFKRTGFRAVVGSNSPVAWQRGIDAVGPDVYVVNGGEDRGQEGWVPWLEGGLCPTLIVEMLSPSTEHRDRGEKMRIYRDVFKTPDYFLFESSTGGVEYYRLKRGEYVRTHADRHGRFRCSSLPLLLGVVDGRLRWFEKNGRMLPEYGELAELIDRACENVALESERADRERERADRERDRADRERDRAVQTEVEMRRLQKEVRRLDEELRRQRSDTG